MKEAESGAALQPGATQPEHDGVAHETERCTGAVPTSIELIPCGLAKGHSGPHEYVAPPSARRGFYLASEVDALLERMARLVVAKLIPHQPLSDDNNEPWRCSMTDCEWKPVGEEPWVEWREHVRDVIESKLQQLREAVERP